MSVAPAAKYHHTRVRSRRWRRPYPYPYPYPLPYPLPLALTLTLQARAELEQLERVQRAGPQRGTAGGATEHAAAAMYADCPVPYPKGRAFYPKGRASRGAVTGYLLRVIAHDVRSLHPAQVRGWDRARARAAAQRAAGHRGA